MKSKTDLWNVKTLSRPPTITYKTNKGDLDIVVLRNVFSEALGTFKNQIDLNKEAALLSRCIYRLKLKLRCEKGLKAMEKTNRALLNYLQMDILEDLTIFHGMIPQSYSVNMYLPTLNMLQFILVRLQGLSKLLVRVMDTSKSIAFYMNQRVRIGQFWRVAFVCMGVGSRIFFLAKNLLKYCCKFYSQLYSFTKVLKVYGKEWLPVDYVFPKSLELWLQVDFLEDPLSAAPETFYLEQFGARKSSEASQEERHMGNVTSNQSCISILNNMFENEDIGEVVENNSFDNTMSKKKIAQNNRIKKKTKKSNKTQQNIKSIVDNIKTSKDLKLFERDFVKYQSSGFFDKLDKIQCNMMHNALKKQIKKIKKQTGNESKSNLCLAKVRDFILSITK